MSITENRIRKIISEEARRVLREGGGDDLPGPKFPPGSVKRPGLEKFASFEPPDGWDDEDEDSDGRWIVDDSGYHLEGAPEVEQAWAAFEDAVKGLERFMDDEFEDTESGEMASVGEIAAHVAKTFLTER